MLSANVVMYLSTSDMNEVLVYSVTVAIESKMIVHAMNCMSNICKYI